MFNGLQRGVEITQLWFVCARLMLDTTNVMTMRVMGMNGAWRVGRTENRDMVQEKANAFTEAMVAGTLTALSGRPPDRVIQAVIEPISDKARSNHARLAEAGPRLPGQPVPSPETNSQERDQNEPSYQSV